SRPVLLINTVSSSKGDIICKPHSRKYMASLQFYGHHICGGFLIRNDFVLTALKQKAKLNKYVEVIDLPTKEIYTPAHTECLVPGWGRTQPSENSPSSDVLKEAVEKIQFNFECKYILKDYFIPEHMICTKFNKTKNGSMCQGDSGGPLICNDKPLGIVAFTHPNDCSNPKYPHGFTKISSFLPWIKKVMGRLGNASEPSTLESQENNIRFN
uniref:Granzyme 3, tandem duplicate 3 n=1 Tax=Neogobius melanostomus TaxID=47308 RepID=A0A8C6V1C0_9GOBI